MNKPKTQVTNSTALRIVKNEVLLCSNCLSSAAGPNPESVYCYLTVETKIKSKEQFCTQGTWLINGKVVDFREGFQMVHNTDRLNQKKDKLGQEKEIKL